MIVGLIFLRYISSAFEKRYNELVAEGDGFEDEPDAYLMDNIFFVPEKARWSVVSAAAHTPEIGSVIDDAMRAIEDENKTLKNAIDETRLFRFLYDTQPDEMGKLGTDKSEQKKRQFLNRLQGELAKRGIVDVLRNGIKVYPADLIMFYLTPTENNAKQREMYEKNIFSVTRQLRYSQDASKLALDLCIFINGLPVITMELKNSLTKQSAEDAVQQYKDDRDPRDILFSFKRCMVHFAVDDCAIKFCTQLCKEDSWFLPFNKGYNDGAGNPPNPDGIMTDYLWKDILTK